MEAGLRHLPLAVGDVSEARTVRFERELFEWLLADARFQRGHRLLRGVSLGLFEHGVPI